MRAREFLLNNADRIHIAGIAKIMFGDKPHTYTLMSKKLHNNGGKKWTSKDEANAITALKQLHIDIGEVIK